MATFEPFSLSILEDLDDSNERNDLSDTAGAKPAADAGELPTELGQEHGPEHTADSVSTPSFFKSLYGILSSQLAAIGGWLRGPPRGPHRRVVVVGGGYGGLAVSRELEKLITKYNLNVEILLVERRDRFFHCIAAVRALTEPGFSEKCWLPYDNIFTTDRGKVIESTEILEIHPSYLLARRTDHESDASARPIEIAYDYLVIATGLPNRIPARFPPSFTRSAEAIELVDALFAKLRSDEVKRIAIIGGGGVGVECAGELKSYFGDRFVSSFRPFSLLRIRSPIHCSKQINLVERMPTLFPGEGITSELRTRVYSRLSQMGVQIWLGWEVIEDRQPRDDEMTDEEVHELGVEMRKGSGKLFFEKHGFVGGTPRTIRMRRPEWWFEARGTTGSAEPDGEPSDTPHEDPVFESRDDSRDPESATDDNNDETEPKDEETEMELETEMQFIFTGNLPPTVPVLAMPVLDAMGDSPSVGPTIFADRREEIAASLGLDAAVTLEGQGNGDLAALVPDSNPIATNPRSKILPPHEPHDSLYLDPHSFELRVNPYLQLSSSKSNSIPTPHIFAVGDVCGIPAPKLAWSAKAQGKVVAGNIVRLIKEEGRFGIPGVDSVRFLEEDEERNGMETERDTVWSELGSEHFADGAEGRDPSSVTFLPSRLEFLNSLTSTLDVYADYEATTNPVGLIVMMGRNGGVAQLPVLGVLGDRFVAMTKARDGGLGLQRREMGL